MMSLSMEDEVTMMLGIMRLEKPNQTLSNTSQLEKPV